jgi:hypothetical protein
VLHTVQLVAWVACWVSLVGVLLSGIILTYTRPLSDEHLISVAASIIMAFSFGLVGALA